MKIISFIFRCRNCNQSFLRGATSEEELDVRLNVLSGLKPFPVSTHLCLNNGILGIGDLIGIEKGERYDKE